MSHELRKTESISAVYAAASGISPAASTRQGSSKGSVNRSGWPPHGLSASDVCTSLRVDDELPEMMAALVARNRNWASIANRRKSRQSTISDEDLYVRPSGRNGR